MISKKDFFKLINSSVFGKTIKSVRKYEDIKLVTTEKKRYYLESELNYHATTFFSKNLIAIEMKHTQMFMNKPVYLGLSVLEISKIATYEFWYDYVKPEYNEKAKLCYVDTDSFLVYVQTEDIYEDIAEDVEKRFDTSNFELERPFPNGKKLKSYQLNKR